MQHVLFKEELAERKKKKQSTRTRFFDIISHTELLALYWSHRLVGFSTPPTACTPHLLPHILYLIMRVKCYQFISWGHWFLFWSEITPPTQYSCCRHGSSLLNGLPLAIWHCCLLILVGSELLAVWWISSFCQMMRWLLMFSLINHMMLLYMIVHLFFFCGHYYTSSQMGALMLSLIRGDWMLWWSPSLDQSWGRCI